MQENHVKYLEGKLDKEIKCSKTMRKRVIKFIRKEQEEKEASKKKKKDASCRSKKGETTNGMVARSFNGSQGCSKDVWAWRK
jgi:hypothetical protein